MNILYITQMYPSYELPQYCAFLHNQVKAIKLCGANITVVIPSIEKLSQYTNYDGIDVLYVKYRDFSRSALGPLVYFQLKREIAKYIKVSDFNIVYAIHSPVNILYSAMRIAKANRLPFIVHYRGYNIFNEFESVRKAFLDNPQKAMEHIVKNTDLSLAVSKRTAAIITNRFPDSPVEVVYNGVDAKIFNCDLHIPSHEGFRILCVANLIPIKGHKYLFDAFKQLSEQYPEKALQLDLVGRGPYENDLKEYVLNNSIKNVFFHGYVLHTEIADYMKNTDIFVLPSVYESFGNVCLEAMACKKPIVIFSGQGIDEIITDGINGLIAEKVNVEQLKEKIECLLLYTDKRNAIAENGYKTAKSFTWQKSGEKLYNIIKKVIAKYVD
ncbi:MAG: glycosyltransferase family 4 protein [Clostridia bacterium]|nr:glycosyltransferase family 4 protein [Clostridia bacterium]MBR4909994.1 glycosyltransferase family 4 protein [Clostridia bacterium]